jgi:histidine triad (HIT) family protein
MVADGSSMVDDRYWKVAVAAGNHVAVSEACVFCDIVRDSVAADVVWRDDVVVAFLDRSPLFHGHTLVVPRRHVLTLPDLAVDEVGPFFERVRLIAAAMPGALGAQGTFVANNNVVSQSVAHLHVHVVPRTRGDGLRGFFWPRQRYADGEAAPIAAALRRELTALSTK